MRQIIVIALLALASPALAQSQLDYTVPPFKMSCVGKLELTDNSKAIRLNTEMMHGKTFNWEALACQESIIDPKQIEKVRAACEIGDVCEISGMIKGFSHDIFDWTRINQVRKRT